MNSVDIDQVKSALSILYDVKNTTSAQRKEANKWLEHFQKTTQAWTIINQLIRSSDASLEQKLFAAQTFRQKIEYDLRELDLQTCIALRDSVLELCNMYISSKPMRKQLSISLADLAIQLAGDKGWNDPVGYMIEGFQSGGPDQVSVLLEFLSNLPEELACNSKIVSESTEFFRKEENLIKANASKVLTLLFTFLQQCGDNDTFKSDLLTCLCSWIRSGSIPADVVVSCNLVQLSFQVLRDPSTFDIGVDLVCELIIISSKKPRSEELTNAIYPNLINILSFLKENAEDGDVVRGICRIVVEACEGYADLVVANFDSFSGLVEGLLFCTSNEDSDIVKLTIHAWYQISDHILELDNSAIVGKQFFNIYKSLVSILINFMKYPSDHSTMSAQDRDEFREFRHDLGDILKDCVRVLGEEAALEIPYLLLQRFFGLDAQASQSIVWQEVEAPLFSLRVMCREVSEKESRFVPEIMGMLPKLPQHPKVTYAAILVIGRYAQWSNHHPELLTYQLDFVSKGFQGDKDTTIAAAHAFRDLCKYCNKHLVNYLEQLQPFYTTTIETIVREDKKEMAEAVSHLLSAVPIDSLPQALELFCMPVAKRIYELISAPINEGDVESILKLNDSVDELGNLIAHINVHVPDNAPHPTVVFLQNVWVVLDQFVTLYGSKSTTAEPMARCFRKLIESTQLHFAPILPLLLTKIVQGFEQSKLSCYLWIAAKCVRVFGGVEQYQQDIRVLIESLTSIVFLMVQNPGSSEEPEIVIEEYHYLLSQFIDSNPFLFLQAKLAPATLQCALHCLSTAQDESSISSILKYLLDLFEMTKAERTSLLEYSLPIVIPLMRDQGSTLMSHLFRGLVYNFSKDRGLICDVADVIYVMSRQLGVEPVFTMIGETVSSFPKNELSVELQGVFLTKIKSVLDAGQPVKLEINLRDFAAAYARRNLISSRR